MSKVGIFGGTFDPIHFGHLRIALDTLQQLQLEQVRFIPCGEPPHRDKPVATALQRLAMVRAAIARASVWLTAPIKFRQPCRPVQPDLQQD